MSDNLKWLNRHFVLLRHLLLSDAIEKENYKIRPDLAELFEGRTKAEDMVWEFADIGRFKCACELLAHIAHRRAAVWWVYNCVLSLNEELLRVPADERDIDDIAASFEPVVPDFAKVEPPAENPEMVSKMEAMIAEMSAEYQKARAAVDPDIMKFVEDGLEIAYREFEKVHGIHPLALFEKAAEKLTQDPYPMDENSPIFKAADELKQKLQTVRKETVDTIKAVIPPQMPEHRKQISDNALQAVYRWVVSPDETNSKKALDTGNECPDMPAGLLALCAFWAGGNLLPEGEQVVPTPPGLAANGLCQVLLMCALHKGGTRKLKERYEHYFNLGVDVMTGQNNWDLSVIEGEAPHEEQELPNADPSSVPAPEKTVSEEEEKKIYTRWRPEFSPASRK